MMTSIGFETVDGVALAFFLSSWVLHFWVVNFSPIRNRTISDNILPYRKQWMINMVGRELKMPDVLIQNSLQQGVLFFASTSILIIGVLLAGLGAAETAVMVLNDLPLSSMTTQAEWDIKVLLVLFIFMFAFFKFAWSYRIFNYVLIMIGAAPESAEDTAETEHFAEIVTRLHAIGTKHFTTGLNSYFFALGAIGWFLNAWVFIATTVWVSLVLYRRAFRSECLRILMDGLEK